MIVIFEDLHLSSPEDRGPVSIIHHPLTGTHNHHDLSFAIFEGRQNERGGAGAVAPRSFLSSPLLAPLLSFFLLPPTDGICHKVVGGAATVRC